MTDKLIYDGVIEVSEYLDILDKIIHDMEGKPTLKASIDLLKMARDLRDSKVNLKEAREFARRNLKITTKELSELLSLVDLAREESYEDSYYMMQVLEAAATSTCTLFERHQFTVLLSVTSKQCKRFEEARSAYADVIANLQILERYLPDPDWAKMEKTSRKGWESVRQESELNLDIFQPESEDPSIEWVDLILWNLDEGLSHGIISQFDAVFRLTSRMEYWCDVMGKSLARVIERMSSHIEASVKKDPYLAVRCYATLGNALMEMEEWDLAVSIFDKIPQVGSVNFMHPIGIHAIVQEAFCRLMMGDETNCGALLDKLDRKEMESKATRIVTVEAEYGRYLTVLWLRTRQKDLKEIPEDLKRMNKIIHGTKMNKIMHGIAPNFLTENKTRVSYLRQLYFAILQRDIKSMMAG